MKTKAYYLTDLEQRKVLALAPLLQFQRQYQRVHHSRGAMKAAWKEVLGLTPTETDVEPPYTAYLQLSYELQVRGLVAQELPVLPQIQQNLDALRRRDLSRLTKEVRDLVLIHTRHEGEDAVTKKKATKTTSPKARKRKIVDLVLELLRRKEGPPAPDAFIKLVKKEFPDSAFQLNHIAWYIRKFSKGELTGQTKPELIVGYEKGPRMKKLVLESKKKRPTAKPKSRSSGSKAKKPQAAVKKRSHKKKAPVMDLAEKGNGAAAAA